MRAFTWSRRRWYAEVNTWPISRFRFMLEWADERQWFCSLSWGTPGCDPVWMIEYHRVIGEPAGKLIDRWYARRR